MSHSCVNNVYFFQISISKVTKVTSGLGGLHFFLAKLKGLKGILLFGITCLVYTPDCTYSHTCTYGK